MQPNSASYLVTSAADQARYKNQNKKKNINGNQQNRVKAKITGSSATSLEIRFETSKASGEPAHTIFMDCTSNSAFFLSSAK
ncbi:hypothetical protein F511_45971 [Dorcoceras hygrometricum]|uniref:Uncharacterized protein n=1 Tax=Dorcoceras hygrometricum TaxID=472368 RepID=A0A2Z6ZUN8_9LAMI|nr:hypothetical protein F511_45971 [Dorcoceras hygrometricum]